MMSPNMVLASRQVIKRDLRVIAQIGVVAVLGRVPRNLRRKAGTAFANASYRAMHGLPAMKADLKTNKALIDWIIKNYKEIDAKRNAELAPTLP